jgi:uncharacterized Fe-S cluster-containing radical SAM superfamily enzyme
MELVENLIKRNKEDMKRINLLIKSLDKLKSKEVAGRIQNILIEEVLRLSELNKQLETYKQEVLG